jgi:tRNA(Ile)-lysidine synthase
LTPPELTTEAILKILTDLPPAGCYWVAYSGGVDSHVLLHLIASLRSELKAGIRAIHVNHGLMTEAVSWSCHCERVCEQLGIPFVVARITSPRPDGASLEAWARERRYELLAQHLRSGEILLTAHHQQDQAETLLLQLLRGSGAKGLSAMPRIQRFHDGWQARPLLGFTREQVLGYANRNGLQWVEDHSNTDECLDRNYLRRQIWPKLQEHWPGATRTLARAAAHQAEAAALLACLAQEDLRDLRLERANILDNRRLQAIDRPRLANLLRHWLGELGLPLPNSAKIQQMIETVVHSRCEANPCVNWGDAEVRRYRYAVCAASRLPPPVPEWTTEWDLHESCVTPMGVLQAELVQGRGIRRDAIEHDRLRVHYRNGGERIRPEGDAHHRDLRKLFQQRGVFPWYRNWVPLLFIGDRLAAVAGMWMSGEVAAGKNEPGWAISWSSQSEVVAPSADW